MFLDLLGGLLDVGLPDARLDLGRDERVIEAVQRWIREEVVDDDELRVWGALLCASGEALLDHDDVGVSRYLIHASVGHDDVRTVELDAVVEAGGAHGRGPHARIEGEDDVLAELLLKIYRSSYNDKSFTFVCKTPPAAVLIKKAAGLSKASGEPNKNKVGTITTAQASEIAETKMQDLNAANIEAATEMIKGTARSMGIVVED